MVKKRIEDVLDKEFYEFLCNSVKECVCESSIDAVAVCNRLVMLGSNLPDAFDKTVTALCEKNPNIKITLVSTEKQNARVPEKVKGAVDWIEWTTNYSAAICDELKKKDYFSEIDGFMYLGRTPVNMRDMNIYSICADIAGHHSIKMYMRDYSDLSVYEYKDLELYYTGMELYKVMNKYIGLLNK